jgi:hypothetical protein
MGAEPVFEIQPANEAARVMGSSRLNLRASQAGATKARIRPLVGLNLVCLDAPLVAVVWQELFAQTFGLRLGWPVRAMLFLSAWFIYLLDRWLDVIALTPIGPRPLRQGFWVGKLRLFGGLAVLVGLADLAIGWFAMERWMFVSGALVGSAALVYLITNHVLSWIWRVVPVKECWVGFVFAGGTIAALTAPMLSRTASIAPLVISLVLLGLVCSLNCISIAVWERDIDLAQAKVSIATVMPGMGKWLTALGGTIVGLTVVSAITMPQLMQVAICVGMSAVLLRLIPGLPVSRDERTALADLVLLTPLVMII